MSLPFGWTGSPAHYSRFGSAITFLVRRECPQSLIPGHADDSNFFCHDWVDDYVLIEPDSPDRGQACEAALRLAMPQGHMHVRAWIENKVAVAWCNKLQSGNEFSQEMSRVIGAAESVHGFRVSTAYIAGKNSDLADLGSRAWSDNTLVAKWRVLTSSWRQVYVPTQFIKIYNGNFTPFKPAPSPIRLDNNINRLGDSGVKYTLNSGGRHGYQEDQHNYNLFGWLSLQSACGTPGTDLGADQPDMSKKSLPTSNGFTESSQDSTQSSLQDMPQPLQECARSAQLHNQKPQSYQKCWSGSALGSTSATPSIALFWGCDTGLLLFTKMLRVPVCQR
ncbi:hypothetical protein PHMEG_00027102 [Phytophthora megakarya]|uniref:Reverse transcriptase n=1 Tax=Phytophthora megakarya TaxID=4795 RepID=A0A225V7N6_9STRA|nr:hypothetical protein PHMEG_00027102 [Phytophthora megakarya]